MLKPGQLTIPKLRAAAQKQILLPLRPRLLTKHTIIDTISDLRKSPQLYLLRLLPMSSPLADAAAMAKMTPPTGPIPWGRAASRRMCAGVYLDRAFRNQLLRTVYCDNRRRVAPSYGFDLVVVLTHAWRAWRLELIQQLIVLAILAVALRIAPWTTLIAAAALAIWYLGGSLARIGKGLGEYYRGQRTYPEFEALKSRGNLLGRAMLAALIVFAGLAAWRLHTSTKKSDPLIMRSGVGGATLVFLAILAAFVIIGILRQIRLNHLRNKDTISARLLIGRRLSTIAKQQRHPFTVYSGFRPFVGSGLDVRTWSFAQRLVHHKPTGNEPDEDYLVPPFRAQELVRRLKTMIEQLRDGGDIETRLPGLTVTDNVFVEATHADPYRPVLKTTAGSEELDDAIAAVIANSSDAARHYLACQVESWGGEVVTTVFVHVSLQGRTLYLEFSTYALLPTRHEYHVIDEVGGTGPSAVIRAAARSLTDVADAFALPRRLAEALGQVYAALRAQRDGTHTARRGVNIGATTSAREIAASGSDKNYFQLRDVLQHSKIVERRLIAAVGDFLKERNVDTSEFWERATTILNNGVMNTGKGTVNISDSAIGDQARVNSGVSPSGGGPPPSASGEAGAA